MRTDLRWAIIDGDKRLQHRICPDWPFEPGGWQDVPTVTIEDTPEETIELATDVDGSMLR